jgi:WD40 repeat protein
VIVLNVRTHETVRTFTGIGDLEICAVAISTLGDRVAACGSAPEHRVLVWDVATGQPLNGISFV